MRISHIAVRWRDFKMRMTHQYVFGSKQNDTPYTKYKITEVKRIVAQQRQKLNDTPHVLSRGGYALLKKKMRKRCAEELGLESPNLAPPLARHELWKAARTKSNGQFTSQSAQELSQRIDDLVDQKSQGTFVAQGREDLLVAATGRLDRPGHVRVVGGAIGLREYFGPKPRSTEVVTQEIVSSIRQQVYRPEKQPIVQPVNEARKEAEDDNDAISILTSRLNKLRKGPVEMLWELRTFGLECHVPLYINFDDAYEIIGGEKMFNISCIQLWCM
ncbi:hypothetical protein LR48_Vigan02g088200 [Vigna angularis]|uniref:Uncharacterized protein n=1 Tax=Phaseolus angularis TaxID=3914 RepID=A0A0L9TWE3_PHAAN|nr:hypothetical protein LR48_Vigan02g088200 [Vigna angularis]